MNEVCCNFNEFILPRFPELRDFPHWVVAWQGLGVVTVVVEFSRTAHNITRVMYLLDAGRMSLDTPLKLWLRLTLLK